MVGRNLSLGRSGLRFAVAAMTCVGSAVCGGAAEAGDPTPPNILFMTADDLGIEALSSYGNTAIETPNLDRLARHGVLFENAYVTQASCSPSRSTFFTGLWPHQSGQFGLAHRGYAVAEGTPLLPRYLAESGYRTGLIGKVHINLGGEYRNRAWRERLGFDFFARKPQGKMPFDVRAVRASAEEFFEARGDAPFFLMVNFSDPHRHPEGTHGFFRQIRGLPEDPVDAGAVDVLPFVGFRHPEIDRAVANYYNAVRRLDAGVGMVLEVLRERDALRNTLIVFVSDHGAPFTRAKTSTYEAGVRVPMIAAWPGTIPEGRRLTDLVSTIDLMPTFLAAAGRSVPDHLPGLDLLPRLRGETAEVPRRYLFTEFTAHAGGHFYPRRAVRDGRYKLIRNLHADRRPNPLSGLGTHIEQYVDGESPEWIRQAFANWAHPPRFELYDLRADPFEFRNLAGRDDLAEVQSRLREALETWRRETNDPVTEDSANPYTDPGFEAR